MAVTADKLIPGPNSKAEEWIAWYDMIPGGKSIRNSLWLQAWSKWGSKDANTTDLRSYMRKEAGIEITTGGAGMVADAALSVGDKLEDALMMPVYVVAVGGVLALGVGGFMAYQALKNPDAVIKIAGAARGVPIMAEGGGFFSNRRNLWLMGSGSVLLTALIAILYVRYRNGVIDDNILAAIQHTPDPMIGSGTGSYGDTRDLGNSQIFNPQYWRTVPNKVTIWAGNADGSPGPATILAKQIWEAKSTSDFGRMQISDYPEKVVAAFKQLKTKADVSKLADVFEGHYKTPLWAFINDSFMTNNCSANQDDCYFGIATNYLKQVYDWIKNQLT